MTITLDERAVGQESTTLSAPGSGLHADETARSFAASGATGPDSRQVHIMLTGAGGWDQGWIRQLTADLNQLMSLAEGWDGHRARPVSETAVRAIVAILVQVMDVPAIDAPQERPEISPLPDGGLQAEWHAGGVDVEIEVEGDGAAYVLVRDSSDADVVDGDVQVTGLETASPAVTDEVSRGRVWVVRSAVQRLTQDVRAARQSR